MEDKYTKDGSFKLGWLGFILLLIFTFPLSFVATGNPAIILLIAFIYLIVMSVVNSGTFNTDKSVFDREYDKLKEANISNKEKVYNIIYLLKTYTNLNIEIYQTKKDFRIIGLNSDERWIFDSFKMNLSEDIKNKDLKYFENLNHEENIYLK